MSRLATQTANALKRAGITDPLEHTLSELLRVPGLGYKGIAYLAELNYPPKGSKFYNSTR